MGADIGSVLPHWVVAVRIERADGDGGRPDAAVARSPDATGSPDGADSPDGVDSPRVSRVADSADAARAAGGADPRNPPDAAARIALAAEYQATVDATNRAYAIDQGYARVQEIERGTVTPAMKRIEAEDPDRHLVGLEYSLKGKDRLTEKVVKQMAAQPDLTPDQAFAGVKDAIRYTLLYPEDKYATGVTADYGRLEAQGFEFVNSRDTWDYEEYKGINSWWREPTSGQLFEVQFHTQASFEAKQFTHAAYELIRDPATSDEEVEEQRAFQREVFGKVPTPPGIADIPHSHRTT